jgi:hypothetical protein
MKITKALFLLTTISVAAITSAPVVAQQQQRPNIVIIWGDMAVILIIAVRSDLLCLVSLEPFTGAAFPPLRSGGQPDR